MSTSTVETVCDLCRKSTLQYALIEGKTYCPVCFAKTLQKETPLSQQAVLVLPTLAPPDIYDRLYKYVDELFMENACWVLADAHRESMTIPELKSKLSKAEERRKLLRTCITELKENW